MNYQYSTTDAACSTGFVVEEHNNPLQLAGEHQPAYSQLKAVDDKIQSSDNATHSTPNNGKKLDTGLSRAEEGVARSVVGKIFFKERSLVEHQLRSFNEFLEYGLPTMFYEALPLECLPAYNPLAIRIGGMPRRARLFYGEVSVGKPYCTVNRDGKKEVVDLLPHEARLRNMTYSAHLYVNMKLEVYVTQPGKRRQEEEILQTKTETVCIGKIPIMVFSSFCHLHGLTEAELVKRGHCSFDMGGYFIIKGSEKVRDQNRVLYCSLYRDCHDKFSPFHYASFDIKNAAQGLPKECSSFHFLMQKVLIAQEERADQGIYVNHLTKTDTWVATCSPTWRGFTSNESNRGKTFVKLVRDQKGTLRFLVGIPTITEPVSLVIIMRALGVCSDKELLERICYDLTDTGLCKLIYPSIQEADACLMKFLSKEDVASTSEPKSVRDQISAIGFIGTKLRNNVYLPLLEAGKSVLGQLFAQMGGGATRNSYLLGYMVNQLCSAFLGRRPEEDRDSFKNKRLDLTGQLLGHQFRKAMAHLQHDMQKQVQGYLEKDMEVGPIKNFVSEAIVTKSLSSAFTLGSWNTNEGLKSSGVVGVLKRMNPMATLSQLRQVRLNMRAPMTPTDAARHPNFSYWGRICPVQTGDGTDCGLLKNIALTCVISSDSPEEPVLHVLNDCGLQNLEDIAPFTVAEAEKVFVNGRWVGIFHESDTALAIVATLKQLRRGQLIHGEVEIARDSKTKEVHIHTDAGRLLRPLLIVKEQKLVMSKQHLRTLRTMSKQESAQTCWAYLLEEEVVELLGTEEEEGVLIALNQEDLEKSRSKSNGPVYTHSEIDASYILGLGAAMIPFLEHNQASRNLYQADKHCKQSIGFYTTNLWRRSDSSGHQLYYPQKPLVTTRAGEYLQKPELTNGQVVILSVQCYAYNQEDSIIMNQASIDRGLFRSSHFRTYRGEERHNVVERFGKPSTLDTKGAYNPTLGKVDDDGFPSIGGWLEAGDIVIGRVTAEQGNPKLADSSQRLKTHEKGTVDQVLLASEADGHSIAKVRLRSARAPQTGDKFSSMHGQKGVIGAVFSQEDLPFTQQGIVPDIIMNPHALPSRQTVGQVLECVLGKVVATSGQRQNATPFGTKEIAYKFMEQLHQCQYPRGGCEAMCNGTTGKRLKTMITIGATFYQRLDHMVEDKIKYRGSGGPVDVLTRQPVKNRKSMGGVKFGEMERDCMLAHGASAVLQERYFLLSDFYVMFLCTKCRHPSSMDKTRMHMCKFCHSGKHVVQLHVPYACKLLWQELLSMGICIYLDTKLC